MIINIVVAVGFILWAIGPCILNAVFTFIKRIFPSLSPKPREKEYIVYILIGDEDKNVKQQNNRAG